jgi:hypothetical protein
VALTRGIDPTDPGQPARKYVVGGSFDDLDDGRIILGYGLARALRVRVGDRVELWSPAMAELAEKGKAPLPAEFEVCAVIATGFTEVDNAVALIPLRRLIAGRFPHLSNPENRITGRSCTERAACHTGPVGAASIGQGRSWGGVKRLFMVQLSSCRAGRR